VAWGCPTWQKIKDLTKSWIPGHFTLPADKIKTISIVDHDNGSPSSLALLTSQRFTPVCGGMGRPTQEKTRGFIHGFMCLFELLLLLFFSLPCEPFHF
jgi:hypothetical protein